MDGADGSWHFHMLWWEFGLITSAFAVLVRRFVLASMKQRRKAMQNESLGIISKREDILGPPEQSPR